MFKLSLILVILFTFVAPPTSPPACTKAQTSATMQDVIDTLAAERGRILTDFPDFTTKYDKLQSLAVSIKSAIDSADNLNAKNLIKAFLPLFDALVGKLGVNKKILDVVDIVIHIVLNHLPAQQGIVASDDSILIQYKDREVWGCNTKPKLCKQP